MDETGHSGDTGAAEGGDGGESRERTRVNGWATADSPWSYQGPAAEPESEVPAWRRPAAESRAFPRNPAFPSSAVPASSVPAPSPAPAPPGFVDATPPSFDPAPPGFDSAPPGFDSAPPSFDAGRTGEIPPSVAPESPAPRWDNRPRYSDLLSHRGPQSDPAVPSSETRPQSLSNSPTPAAQTSAPAHPGMTTGDIREPGLRTGDPLMSLRRFDVPTPNSAPPYPYEGDLDETPDAPPPPSIARQRSAVPMVRPAAPDARRPEREGGEPARHALNTPVQGVPRVERVRPEAAAEEPEPSRPAYDPSSFPRRLSYESPVPAPYEPPAYEPPFAGFGNRSGEPDPRGLPQRVPAQPDVPQVPEPPLVEPTAETPALARIATHLRRGDVLPVEERQEGFDVRAILAAVREVEGVRDASLRSTPAGAHSLRLDLAEGADPAEVSRQVARLLQDRMGLDAAMQGEGQPTPAPLTPAPPTPAQQPPAESPAPAPVSPSALVPRARPQVPAAPHAPTTSQAATSTTPVSPAHSASAPTSPAWSSADSGSSSRASVAPTSPARSSADPASSSRASSAPTSPAWSSTDPASSSRASSAPTSPAWSSADSGSSSRASVAPTSPARSSADLGSSSAPTSPARGLSAPTSAPPQPQAPVSVPPAASIPSGPARPDSLTRPDTLERSDSAARSETASRSDATRSDSGAGPDAVRSARGARSDATRSDAGGRSDTTRSDAGARSDATRSDAGARSDATRSDAGARSDATRSDAGAGPDAARSDWAARSGGRNAATTSAPARPAESQSQRAELSAQHSKPESSETLEGAEVDCGPPRPLYPGEHPGPRVVIENVQVNTFGADATVEVKLAVGPRAASGVATGPAVDGYLLRLCAMATAGAVDELLSASDHPEGPARCFVEHAAAVPFGASQVAVVVLLLSCGGWVEQLAGSAVVTSDDRHAMVRATLAAVNRRLEALLTR
ncbi:hypothetical protein [Paractinoplanes atraurantiacus]|uniref:Uncharacterized protein n=1 Tax=Paractinoplanes atraurantiacus TaxID=1036182 RepID=A0A285IVV0_9ACTN|nr:hypothetical protein [Actinoplanes atraurantiacus]SNY52159.1 hypothetical protein SAMN05421748_112272 [Actinoplanes atraurantiacus]